jgi:hypothetical protein
MSTSNSDSDFTEETTQYWQEILPQERATTAPWKYGYPAPLPDLRVMMLPIRPMKNPEEPVASLIINQAGINITTELGAFLGQAVRPFNPEVVIGLPTLGLRYLFQISFHHFPISSKSIFTMILKTCLGRRANLLYSLAPLVAQSLGQSEAVLPIPFPFFSKSRNSHQLRALCSTRLLSQVLVFRRSLCRSVVHYLSFWPKKTLLRSEPSLVS